MQFSCMTVLIQIRNVPESIHRRLKEQAAMRGKSLSDYLLAEIEKFAERPTLQELRDRLEQREPVQPCPDPALAVRQERDQQ
ncbi:MAG: FitA-like ribbon-helix-helix domain-containing protein [Verrucomicrobiota bacterium]|jgi:hypothetical protein